jgi:hypothetical protein
MAADLPESPTPQPAGLLRNALTLSASIVIPVGLVIYGMCSVGYGGFYGTLNVDPTDVGLNYAKTLAQATGLIVFLSAALGILLPYGVEHRTREALGYEPKVRCCYGIHVARRNHGDVGYFGCSRCQESTSR